MEMADWVMLLAWMGVVIALIASLAPFLIVMFYMIMKLSDDVRDMHKELANFRFEVGEKLGEVHVVLANFRSEIGEKLGEVPNQVVGGLRRSKGRRGESTWDSRRSWSWKL